MALQQVHVKGTRTSTVFVVPSTWEMVRSLGSGAYATVAAFKDNARIFAVKRVERPLDHPILALRTLREVRLLAHFKHPNILGIQDIHFDGESNQLSEIYLRLDIMDGDLHLLIHKQAERLSEQQAACTLYQLMRGLSCLRVARVVHRDLKPGNVLFKHSGLVKIADLGLARAIDAEGDDESMLTEYVVTRFYRAPEVVLTASKYTYAVDIWSVGCILGEMLTRHQLFKGHDALDQIRKIVAVIGLPDLENMAWIPQGAPIRFMEKLSKELVGQPARPVLPIGSDEAAADILDGMLCFNPLRRITVDQCLQHEYLARFNAIDDADVAKALSHQPVDWSFDNNLCFHADGHPRTYDPCTFRQAFVEARQLVMSAVQVEATGDATHRSKMPERHPCDGMVARNAAAPIAANRSRMRSSRNFL